MHPDDAVDLALQDLRTLTHPAAAIAVGAPRARPALPSLRALWRRYVDGWKWYASSELALPEAGPSVPPLRARPGPAPRRARAARAAAPCVHHRFELLFGRAAAAECR